MTIRVTSLRKTCDACPAQWEGRTDDGQHVYVRYRHGTLRVGVGETPETAVDEAMASPDEMIGADFLCKDLNEMNGGGDLSLEELRQVTRDFAEWPEADA